MRPCDILRHAWFEVPVDFEPPFQGTPVQLRCERCGMERHEIWGQNTGELEYRRYVRPASWIVYPRGEAPTMQELRLQRIDQMITDARKRRRKGNGNNSNGRSHLHGIQGGRASNGE